MAKPNPVVFTSGSCRIGFPLSYAQARGDIDLINPHWDLPELKIGEIAPKALGHFHSLDDHYRLFNLLHGDPSEDELAVTLNIAQYCKKKCFNSPPERSFWKEGNRNHCRFRLDWKDVWDETKKRYHEEADIVFIEYCSFNSSRDLLGGKSITTFEESQQYIKAIEAMVKKPIIWVCNYRPTVLWNEAAPDKDQIRNYLLKTVNYFVDPSDHVKYNVRHYLRDEYHYTSAGFKLMRLVFLNKMNQII